METKGEIIKVMRNRGFGFINAVDQEKDIFFHHSSIQNLQFDELEEGTKVTFNLVETGKGLEAVDINKIDLTSMAEVEEPSNIEE